MIARDHASFRDPAGSVFLDGAAVYRAMRPAGAARFEAVRRKPVIGRLIAGGRLIACDEVAIADWPPGLAEAGFTQLVRHPRLDVITYPYEWPFAALKAAALHHLDLHLDLLDDDLTLIDASAYNVQFDRAQPVFIDLLSIAPYADGAYWVGHDQFLRQFLNPLLLERWSDVSYAGLYRGGMEGIETADLARLLPWRARLSPSMQLDVFLPARLAARARPKAVPEADKVAKARRPLTKQAFAHLLGHLRRVLVAIEPKRRATDWSAYSTVNSYDAEAEQRKRAFVSTFVASARPRQLLDLGCNDGAYSLLALEAGAQSVVGLDGDRPALDRAFVTASARRLPFLPLHMDLANPSPAQGWEGRERTAIWSRLDADALIALAIVHHLAIGRNVPLADVVSMLLARAPAGVIEFVAKDDPMVRVMLARRDDVFVDYGLDAFAARLSEHARIVRRETLPGGTRTLFQYERRS